MQSVLQGSHYVRALHGILVVADVMERLSWIAFWDNHSADDNKQVIDLCSELGVALTNRQPAASKQLY